mgnify:CR=1 FL=1
MTTTSGKATEKERRDAMQVFEEFLATKPLRHSQQRRDILTVFLETEAHHTADELLALARQKNASIGCATLYRTLKLLCDCGLARELKFDDKASRYEHLYGHTHHDHLLCSRCGRLTEVFDPEIERLQDRLSRIHGFLPQHHRMEIYGLCRGCVSK